MTNIEWKKFVYASKQKKAWDVFCDAEHNKTHPFHKLATSQKMSRKRLKGIFMAAGNKRDFAEKLLNDIRDNCGSYYAWWYHNAPNYVFIVDNRLRKQNRKKCFTYIGGAKLAEAVEKDYQLKKKKELVTAFEELKQIAEKYPDLNSKEDCRKAKIELLISSSEPTGEYGADGTEIRRMKPKEVVDETYAKIYEIVKLENYFYYGE